jgi:hypothetical protein
MKIHGDGGRLTLVLMSLMVAGCAAQRLGEQSDESSRHSTGDLIDYGPTGMSKVAGGYELRNRLLRALIDADTGDLIYFGPIGDGRVATSMPAQVVATSGMAASAAPTSGMSESTMSTQPSTGAAAGRSGGAGAEFIVQLNGVTPALRGYVEARDEQTWEYAGEDAGSRTRWRKIYCLDGWRLMASYLCDNQSDAPMPVMLSVVAEGGFSPTAKSSGDTFTQLVAGGTLRVKAFDQTVPPAPAAGAGLPVVWSESQVLAPRERFPWTTVWTIDR